MWALHFIVSVAFNIHTWNTEVQTNTEDWNEIDAMPNICHSQYILVFTWATVFANHAATYSKGNVHCITEKEPMGHPIKHLNTTVMFFNQKWM